MNEISKSVIQQIYSLASPDGGVPKSPDAGFQGKTFVEIKTPGTLELMIPRIYSGAQNTLRLLPRIYKKGSGIHELFTYGDKKQYFDGDDDGWPIPMNIPVDQYDQLVIEYWNTDAVNPHNFRFIFVIDHLYGTKRWFGGGY